MKLIDEIHAEHDAVLNQNLPASLDALREIIKEHASHKDRWEQVAIEIYSTHVLELVEKWAAAQGLSSYRMTDMGSLSGLFLAWGHRRPIIVGSTRDAKIDNRGVLTRPAIERAKEPKA